MNQKRKRVYIDSAVQGTLAKRIGFHWFVFFGIVISLKMLTDWTMNPAATFGETFTNLIQANGLFLVVIVLLLPSFIYDTVKFSHRFAGPMVRLKNELKKAAESGDYKEISFREGDFWAEVAESYNALVRDFNEKLEASSAKANGNEADADEDEIADRKVEAREQESALKS